MADGLLVIDGKLAIKGGELLQVDTENAETKACCCGYPCGCCTGLIRGFDITISGVTNYSPRTPAPDCNDCAAFNRTYRIPYGSTTRAYIDVNPANEIVEDYTPPGLECYGALFDETTLVCANDGGGPYILPIKIDWFIGCDLEGSGDYGIVINYLFYGDAAPPYVGGGELLDVVGTAPPLIPCNTFSGSGAATGDDPEAGIEYSWCDNWTGVTISYSAY